MNRGTKIPIQNFDFDNPYSYDAILDYSDYGLIIPEGVTLVDVDNAIHGSILIRLLKSEGYNVPIMATPNGYHFYFRSTEPLNCVTKAMTPLGILIDIKQGGKKCYAKIRGKNENRHFLTEHTLETMFFNMIEFPVFLKPIRKNQYNIINLEEGSRNDTFFRYINELISQGIQDPQDIRYILSLINTYFLSKPLPMQEINTLTEETKLRSRIKDYQSYYYRSHGQPEINPSIIPQEPKISYFDISKELFEMFKLYRNPLDVPSVFYIKNDRGELIKATDIIRSYLLKKYPKLRISDKKEIFEILDILCYDNNQRL